MAIKNLPNRRLYKIPIIRRLADGILRKTSGKIFVRPCPDQAPSYVLLCKT